MRRAAIGRWAGTRWLTLALVCLAYDGAWAVDANTASARELESVRGIGPAIAARIIDERQRGPYRDLVDLRERVRGIGAANLRRMTEGGLEVVHPAGAQAGFDAAGAGREAGRAMQARGWVRELDDPPVQRRQETESNSPGRMGR